MNHSVFIFVALPCEARPLVQAWKLKKNSPQQPFTIYANDERVVVISGIGKLAMAAAVAYTMCLYPDALNPVLLNFGIAGHQFFPVGSLYLADKITDLENTKNYYPQLTFGDDFFTNSLTTVSKPQINYEGDSLFDMEAAAFYEIATKFNTNELVHCLKIVSDNSEVSLANISEETVIAWITNKIDEIDSLIYQLLKIRDLLPKINTDFYEQMIQLVHFSEASAVKLKQLMQRWQIVMGNSDIKWTDSGASTGKELIAWMEHQLEQKDFDL